jgi:hypothetical protein
LFVQEVPSYSSVAPVTTGAQYNHQKLKLLFEYLLPCFVLAVFKLPGLDVQVVPSYSSVAPVTAGGVCPPKAKAAV